VGVEAAQLVVRPAEERAVDLGVEPEQEGLAFALAHDARAQL
jgi:hypothetical protein